MSPQADDLPLLEPADRAEWRAWLEDNYRSSRGVWLAVGKKGGSLTSLTYDEAVEEAVRFNWIDSTTYRLDDDRFKQLFTPRKPGSNWSRSNKERVGRLSAQGALLPVAVSAIEAAKADGSWNRLDHVEELIVPQDLADALAGDEAARLGFDSLSPSKRKMALFWIATAKRPETRQKRIAETVRAAAEGRLPR